MEMNLRMVVAAVQEMNQRMREWEERLDKIEQRLAEIEKRPIQGNPVIALERPILSLKGTSAVRSPLDRG